METVDSKDYATRLVISLVKSPLYNESQVNLDRELKTYFNTGPQKLTLGEHFSLKSHLRTDLTCQFKVVEVEPNGLVEFWADSRHTRLVLTEQGVADKWIWTAE